MNYAAYNSEEYHNFRSVALEQVREQENATQPS